MTGHHVQGTEPFLSRFLALPTGYGRGEYAGRRYGVTIGRSSDGRRHNLYAEELGGTDRVSLNLFVLTDGRLVLKPCEMPDAKVVAFVMGYRPDGSIEPDEGAGRRREGGFDLR